MGTLNLQGTDKFQKRMSGKLLSHHSMNIYHY